MPQMISMNFGECSHHGIYSHKKYIHNQEVIIYWCTVCGSLGALSDTLENIKWENPSFDRRYQNHNYSGKDKRICQK